MNETFRDGVIKDGRSMKLGTVKDGVIKDERSRTVGKVRNGMVQDSRLRTIGRVKDFTIKGIEREKDDVIVAVYHFLVKKILSE